MPVQQWVYVSVPVRDAYNARTEYKQWPRYMHRANGVDPQIDERQVRLSVTEKIWAFARPFTADVIRQRPDEHILWNTTEGSKHTGVINFHELGPHLTLIEMNLDHAPSGITQKISRGARFTKRAVRADLHRSPAWVEMKSDDELGAMEGWRGQIEGGQIVKTHEDAVEEEQHGRRDEADDRDGFENEQDQPESEAKPTSPRMRKPRPTTRRRRTCNQQRALPVAPEAVESGEFPRHLFSPPPSRRTLRVASGQAAAAVSPFHPHTDRAARSSHHGPARGRERPFLCHTRDLPSASQQLHTTQGTAENLAGTTR